MKNLRWTAALLLFVLTTFFNIERFDWGQQNLVDIQSFVYLMTATAVLSILLLPALQRRSLSLSAFLWLTIYCLGKFFIASRPLVGGIFTYLTITELFFLMLCIGLAHRLGQHLLEFEKSVRDIVLVHTGHPVPTVAAASSAIHTEITRSRHYRRPMSVMLVEPESTSFKKVLNQTVREVEQALRTHYAQAKIAQVMREQLRIIDHVLASEEDGCFVVLCPEADAADTHALAERVESALSSRLNVKVRCSAAAFPDEALTFGGLLQCAGEKLKTMEKDPSHFENMVDRRNETSVGAEA